MKILITGASSGIGYAATERLLANGHHVIGLSRKAENLFHNKYYEGFAIDLAKVNALEAAYKALLQQHPTIDAIICAAGFGQFAALEQWSTGQMQTIMQVNFLSQAQLIKTFLPQMKKKSGGKIIAIGSECALEGHKRATLYSASKFALRGFLQSLRKECAANDIAVSLINPGLVNTAFYDALSFSPGEAPSNAITAAQVAKLIETLINSENNMVVEEINLQPMKKVIKK